MRELLGVGYLLLPLVGGAAVSGLSMKRGWLPALARPVDGGRTFRGRPLFGRGKTYRGILTVGLGSALVCGLQADILHSLPVCRELALFDYSRVNGWLLGFALGVAAMLAELPNSFVKRRLGIASGQQARGAARPLFYTVDQLDLLLGAWIVLGRVVTVTLERVLLSMAIVFIVHQIITFLGYALGVRESPT